MSVAKITRPKLVDVQPRAALFARLDAIVGDGGVPWLAAPAGAGKTTLVASWLEARATPALWYRVDERDDDCAELFFTLRLALEALEGDRRAGVELPSFSPGTDIARFTRRFFDAAFARLPAGGAIVLDDFHLAPESSTWVDGIVRALEHAPHGKSVVVASRRPPPPAFARAQVHGQVVVVDAAALRMSEGEVRAVAAAKGASSHAPAIHEATGGWAAGVALLARNGAGLPCGRGTLAGIDASDGDVQVVFDYLATAVLADLAPRAQEVLQRAAFFPSCTADDVAALALVVPPLSAPAPSAPEVPPVLAPADAHRELVALHRAGVFVERDVDVIAAAETRAETHAGARAAYGQEAYRLHPLMRSFLSYRAARTFAPERLRAAQCSAARLLARRDRDDDAFDLFAAAGAYDELRDIVVARAAVRVAQGRAGTVQRWLGVLGDGRVTRDGWLSYWRGTLTLTTSPAASRADFERALARFLDQEDGAGAWLAWAGGVQAITYEVRAWHGVEAWLARLADVEAFCPSFPSPEVSLQVSSSLVMALTLVGAEPEVIARWADRALGLADAAADPAVRVMTTSVLVLNRALRGDSGHAIALLERLERATTASSSTPSGPFALVAHVAAKAATATLSWHRADAGRCASAAKEGLEAMGDARVPMWQAALLVFGSWGALDAAERGDVRAFDEVNRNIARLAAIAEASGAALDVAAYHAVRARLALGRGQLAAALDAFELALDRDRAVGFGYGQGADLLAISFLAAELGDGERAAQARAEAMAIEARDKEPVLRFWRLLQDADRLVQQGRRADALAPLAEACALGEDKGVYNTQCPPAPRIAALCALALAEDVAPAYVKQLVRRRALAHPPGPVVDGWPCPLRVRMLGPLVVENEDGPVALGRARMPPLLLRAVVALGSAHPDVRGVGAPVARVADALWPDAEGDAAAHSFEMTLSRLRKQLGRNGHRALRVEAERVWLDPAVVHVDVLVLDALLDEVARGVAPGRAQRCADRLRALVRGPFADDDEGLRPLLAFDRRLRTRIQAAAQTIAAALVEAGAPAEPLFAALAAADPRLATPA